MKTLTALIAAAALVLGCPMPASAMEARTTYTLNRDGERVSVPEGVVNVPAAGGWQCKISPRQTTDVFELRHLVCMRGDAALAASAVCAKRQRDVDVQRITIGDKSGAGVTLQFSCMTDLVQES